MNSMHISESETEQPVTPAFQVLDPSIGLGMLSMLGIFGALALRHTYDSTKTMCMHSQSTQTGIYQGTQSHTEQG